MQNAGCIYNAGLNCSARESCRHCGWYPVEAAERSIAIRELLRTSQRSVSQPVRLVLPQRETAEAAQ